ncbi:GTP-binding protein isoform 2 [Hibiscus syriacus]|uniref:GTP-binding protein isoform 2 n=1 Tax=Hibiscus syriacus TaxID=106335 RepID=A0A6A2YHD5_HIBSY|nr:GTP-binding protein isoform 2 [Hibiscus syriacus]
MKNGSEFLLIDTVGFIQKLPTTLNSCQLCLMVASCSLQHSELHWKRYPSLLYECMLWTSEQQIDAVEKVLAELDVYEIPKLMVWNKVDRVSDPQKIKLEAKRRENVVCISALTGEGLQEFCNAVQGKLKDSMVPVEALLPFDKGELLSTIHQVGILEKIVRIYRDGPFVKAFVPLRFARLLTPMRQLFDLGESGGFSVQHCPNTSVYRKPNFVILKDVIDLDSNEWSSRFLFPEDNVSFLCELGVPDNKTSKSQSTAVNVGY